MDISKIVLIFGISLLIYLAFMFFGFFLKNKNLIKRIISVNQNNIEVIGDNIEFSEDSNKFGLINNEKIIGIVTSKLIIPKLKNFLIQKNSSTSLNPK